ncbi:hypothetical protein L1049_007176 [Liquidambar formosana]|uniref:Uncharacterized protein n=1 Tax=Liquidambar formosana TaxID=63359 RepID=A0AAP0WV34_LIQFO
MATLQKFKLFATQCAVPRSTTLSPTSSAVLQFRRRKSFRNLLSCHSGRRSPPGRDLDDRERLIAPEPEEKNKKDVVGRTLKDLFGSSPSLEDDCEVAEKIRGKVQGLVEFPCVLNGLGGGPAGRVGFRHKLLRRAWRPMLSTIPEEWEIS